MPAALTTERLAPEPGPGGTRVSGPGDIWQSVMQFTIVVTDAVYNFPSQAFRLLLWVVPSNAKTSQST